MNIKKIIPSLTTALVLATSVNAGVGVDSVGVNVGCMNITSEQSDKKGTITDVNMPEEQMLQAELYMLIGGVFDDKSWKPTVNYMYAQNSDLTNHMLMIGLNKYFYFDNFNLYGGVLAGTGQVEWKYNPINSTKDNDYKVASWVGAVQAGVEYPITKSLALGLNAKYYLHDYDTALIPSAGAESEITQSNACSLAIGLRFSFGGDEKKKVAVQSIPVVEEEVPEVIEPVQEEKIVEQVQEEVLPVVVLVEDSDNDGVLDEDDKCSNTPEGITIDASGCAVDSDNDGIADYKDQCIATPLGFEVDVNGCAASFTIAINFTRKSIDLPTDVDADINEFVEYMQANPNVKADIIGHSSRTAVSGDAYNMRLSKQRADIFKDEVIKRGVDASRLSTQGKGFHEPIADNSTAEGRYLNRRIEIDFRK